MTDEEISAFVWTMDALQHSIRNAVDAVESHLVTKHIPTHKLTPPFDFIIGDFGITDLKIHPEIKPYMDL